MNGIPFAPGPGSARAWEGRGARPDRRPGPPWAGPARTCSLCVCLCVCLSVCPPMVRERRSGDLQNLTLAASTLKLCTSGFERWI